MIDDTTKRVIDRLDAMPDCKNQTDSQIWVPWKQKSVKFLPKELFFLDFACLICIYVLKNLNITNSAFLDDEWADGLFLTTWEPFVKNEQVLNHISIVEYIEKLKSFSFEVFDNINSSSGTLHIAQGNFILRQLTKLIGSVCRVKILDPSLKELAEDIVMLSYKFRDLKNESKDKPFYQGCISVLVNLRKTEDISLKWSTISIPKNEDVRAFVLENLSTIFIKNYVCSKYKTFSGLPEISLLKDIQGIYKLSLCVAVKEEKILKIEEAVDFLLHSKKSIPEIGRSNEWFRKPARKVDTQRLSELGIAGWEANGCGELDPSLVANYLKLELRAIPGGLISKPIQDLLIFVMGSDNLTIKYAKIKAVQNILGIEPSRLRILSLLGKISRFIFENCAVKIKPTDLSKIMPVESDAGSSEVLKPRQMEDSVKCRRELEETIFHIAKWTGVFGTLLANSEMFFENEFGSKPPISLAA